MRRVQVSMRGLAQLIGTGLVLLLALAGSSCSAPISSHRGRLIPPPLSPAERVELARGEWRLVADLQRPYSLDPRAAVPAVLLLNKAAGSRSAYAGLASALAHRGVASLRLDLSAHGESVNLGRFEPGQEMPGDALPSEDIAVALSFLRATRGIDAARLAVVGASYSGEAALVAARKGAAARVYALLSPGSLTDTSVAWLDRAGAPWFYVASRTERSPAVRAVTEMVLADGRHADVLLVEGPPAHATDLLTDRPVLDGVLADWLASALAREPR